MDRAHTHRTLTLLLAAALGGCAADVADGAGGGAPGCLGVVDGEDGGRDLDGDGLTDAEECLRYASDPERVDTDLDGLDDGVEVRLHRTSPGDEDTDGDDWSDLREVRQGTNPLVADVPVIEVSIATAPTVALNAVTTEGGAEVLRAETTSLRTASTAVSETDARATSTTMQRSQEVSASASASYPWGASVSVEGRESFEQGYTQERTTSWTRDSVAASEDAAARARTAERTTERTYADGTVRVGFDVRNLGGRDVVIENLTVAALHRDILSIGDQPAFVAELRPSAAEDGAPAEVQINAGAMKGPLESVNREVEADLVKRLLAFPAGLHFEVSGFDMEVLDPEGGASQRFTASSLTNRTAAIVLDFGDGRVDRHLVATGLDRHRGGIRMADALAAIGLVDVDGAPRWETAPRADDGVRVLTRVRNVAALDRGASPLGASCPDGRGFWFVSSTSESLDRDVDFEEVVLRAGDIAQLTYLTDCDGDALPDRAEIVLGSDPVEIDTDGDGIDDDLEVNGWLSFGDTRTSDPRAADTDGDGLDDLAEGAEGSDPRDPCDPVVCR